MSLNEDVKDIKERLDVIIPPLPSEKSKRKGKKFRIPFKFKSPRKYKDGKALVLFLRSNHKAEFDFGEIHGGLIKVNDETYKAYESGAIYFLKRLALCVVFEWRLTPAGGVAEEFRSRVIGGDEDKKVAETLGIASFAEQTLIRGIQAEEVAISDDLKKKKKKGGSVIFLIIAGIVVLFVLGKIFGVV